MIGQKLAEIPEILAAPFQALADPSSARGFGAIAAGAGTIAWLIIGIIAWVILDD